CTQCHDHKYDPIKQTDYYSLLAFFNNIPENGLDGRNGNAVPMIKTPSSEQAARLGELNDSLKAAERKRASTSIAEIENAELAWERSLPAAAQKPAIADNVAAILSVAPATRTQQQQDDLLAHYVHSAPSLVPSLDQQFASAKKARDELEAKVPTAM